MFDHTMHIMDKYVLKWVVIYLVILCLVVILGHTIVMFDVHVHMTVRRKGIYGQLYLVIWLAGMVVEFIGYTYMMTQMWLYSWQYSAIFDHMYITNIIFLSYEYGQCFY